MLLQKWLGRGFGRFIYRLEQVLSGHGVSLKSWKYDHRGGFSTQASHLVMLNFLQVKKADLLDVFDDASSIVLDPLDDPVTMASSNLH